MPLAAGRLRHRIQIQEPVIERDSSDEVVQEWIEFKTVWAEIAPISGKEFIAASAEQSQVTGRITVRWLAGLTANMRIFHIAKSKYYNIEAILPDKESGLEYQTILVSEGVRV